MRRDGGAQHSDIKQLQPVEPGRDLTQGGQVVEEPEVLLRDSESRTAAWNDGVEVEASDLGAGQTVHDSGQQVQSQRLVEGHVQHVQVPERAEGVRRHVLNQAVGEVEVLHAGSVDEGVFGKGTQITVTFLAAEAERDEVAQTSEAGAQSLVGQSVHVQTPQAGQSR